MARSQVASGGSPARALTPRTLSRLLCCAGAVLLVQNLALLRFGYELSAGWCDEPPDVWPPRGSLGGRHFGEEVEALTLLSSDSLQTAPPTAIGGAVATQATTAGPPVMIATTQKTTTTTLRPAPTPLPSQPHPTVSSPQGGSMQQLHRESALASVDLGKMRIFGHESSTRGTNSLVVGITASSDGADEKGVIETVKRMFTSISGSDLHRIVVVVHLRDAALGIELQEAHRDHIDAGRLHAIHTPVQLPPKVDVCPPFCPMNAAPERVRDFAKHNVDCALLMYYAAPMGDFYLQLEDVVSFTAMWMGKLSSLVAGMYSRDYRSKESNAPWRVIDLTGDGILGVLFQGDEVLRLAQHILLFYDQMPTKELIDTWMRAMTQGKTIQQWKTSNVLMSRGAKLNSGVTCGNHRASSCGDCPQGNGAPWCNVDCVWLLEQCVDKAQAASIQSNVDTSSKVPQPAKLPQGRVATFDNPAAKMVHNMTVVETYGPRFAYWPGGEPASRLDSCNFKLSPVHSRFQSKQCWLWAKRVERGNHFTLVFHNSIGVKEIIVEFGSEGHPKDILDIGEVQLAPELHGAAQGEILDGAAGSTCGAFSTLAMVRGQQQVLWEAGKGGEGGSVSGPARARCLRIFVSATQNAWLIILRILIRSG